MQKAKGGNGLKRQFKRKSHDKMRALPQAARDKCEQIERRAERVKSRLQKHQNKHHARRVATAHAKIVAKEGNSPQLKPHGGGIDPQMVKAKTQVAKRHQSQLNRVDAARRNMQNAVAKKHHVVLHPERSQKQQLSRTFSRSSR